MFSVIVTQLVELQIPQFLVRLVLGIEIKTNLVEPPFSFLIHSTILEACTLCNDPLAQCRVKAIPFWHSTCNAGREDGRVLVEVVNDDGKTVDIPKQLTVTMFYIIILQLFELQIPFWLVRPVLQHSKLKTNLVELLFSFKIHSTFFEDGTLLGDPFTKLRVKAGTLWNLACNAAREEGGVLVEVFKMKVIRWTVQNNSQWPCFPL
jgi:hypothetical protein